MKYTISKIIKFCVRPSPLLDGNLAGIEVNMDKCVIRFLDQYDDGILSVSIDTMREIIKKFDEESEG